MTASQSASVTPSSPVTPASLGRLQASLDAMQLTVDIEARGALAILVPSAPRGEALGRPADALRTEGVEGAEEAPAPASPRPTSIAPPAPLDASTRRAVVQAALAAGFSHVAVEIPLPHVPPHVDAPLSGRHPA